MTEALAWRYLTLWTWQLWLLTLFTGNRKRW